MRAPGSRDACRGSSGQLPHGLAERLSALLEIAEHVEARARGREDDRVPLPCGFGRRAHRLGERAGDGDRRRPRQLPRHPVPGLPQQHDGPGFSAEGGPQGPEVHPLVLAPGDQDHRFGESLECGENRAHVGPLGVVVVRHSPDRPDEIHPLRQSREQRELRPPPGAVRSAITSPERKAPSARMRLAENGILRARIEPRRAVPSGSSALTTAVSDGSWLRKTAILASKYASFPAYRSRWSSLRFNSAATRGRNDPIDSSWKLETSTTPQSQGAPAAATNGVPRFPPTNTRGKARDAIPPTRVVTVDLPLVPVIAATFPRKRRNPSSSSPHTGRPAAESADSGSFSRGTPGDTTTSAVPGTSSPVGIPRRKAIAAGIFSPTDASTSARGRSSRSVPRAPSPASRRAARNPDRPAPATITCLPVKVPMVTGSSAC